MVSETNVTKLVEDFLFERYAVVDAKEIPIVFVIASPRTGSTLLYQILVNGFTGFFPFTNYINIQLYKFPALATLFDYVSLGSYESNYGKVEGLFSPSEASFLFKEWFGGEHPAQTKSCDFLSLHEKSHMVSTMKVIHGATGKVVLSKNQWNSFRVRTLFGTFPNLHFIWVRRDIADSAFSDLKARRHWKSRWNSATTANYERLMGLPDYISVVEQQYEYNKAIEDSLKRFCPQRYIEVWYEDVCEDINIQVYRLRDYFDSNCIPARLRNPCVFQSYDVLGSKVLRTDEGDCYHYRRIKEYVNNHHRFLPYIRKK